ncbi:MAG: hypothetical protein PVH19_07245 [Planctomycetia bacterium]
MNGLKKRRSLQSILLVFALFACFGATGCTVDVAGQMHPSPWYLTDDVQYFPAGPEFPLAREAAAMKAYQQGLSGIETPAATEEPKAAAEEVPAPVGE